MANYSIPTDKQIAEKARSLIMADLSHPQSLPAVATECGVTSYTLKRIFRKIYGLSIAEYSLKVRMEKAKELLSTTNNTLQMIAESVGYTEGTNFQNAFKRLNGVTPGKWRKQHFPASRGD